MFWAALFLGAMALNVLMQWLFWKQVDSTRTWREWYFEEKERTVGSRR